MVADFADATAPAEVVVRELLNRLAGEYGVHCCEIRVEEDAVSRYQPRGLATSHRPGPAAVERKLTEARQPPDAAGKTDSQFP